MRIQYARSCFCHDIHSVAYSKFAYSWKVRADTVCSELRKDRMSRARIVTKFSGYSLESAAAASPLKVVER